MSGRLLSLTGVGKRYGGFVALDQVSMSVVAGERLGLIGPNGSGKTTLLRLLAGTRRPASGRILLDGKPIASLSRAATARRMAVVSQETHLAFDYSVLARSNLYAKPWALVFPVIGALALAGIAAGVGRQRDGLPFAMTALFFLASCSGRT